MDNFYSNSRVYSTNRGSGYSRLKEGEHYWLEMELLGLFPLSWGAILINKNFSNYNSLNFKTLIECVYRTNSVNWSSRLSDMRKGHI